MMQAERAVGCPGDAAAVPPTEHVGAMGATYEAAKTRRAVPYLQVPPPLSLSFSLLSLMTGPAAGTLVPWVIESS